jgi:hypothetical protein
VLQGSHSRCTFHMAATTSGRILAAYRSRLLASSPTAIYRSAFRHSSPIDRSGLLAVADAVGSSTCRAGTTALWIASVDDTASTYFHTTHSKPRLCKTRLRMYTWLFRILKMLIYMSFNAQHHNTVVGRDTTSSTPSWTQQDDLAVTTVVTTRRRSFSFNCVFWIVGMWLCELLNNCVLWTHFSLNCRELCWIYRMCLYCAYFRSTPGGSQNRQY